MATNAEHQRRFRLKMAERGLITVSGYCTPNQRPGVLAALALLASHPDFEIAQLRDTRTGRFVKV